MMQTEKHISRSFDSDLNEVMKDFCKMGRLAIEQVTKATHSLTDNDVITAEEVIHSDKVVNKMEIDIDEQIVLIVAKRQPTASDLRLVMALSKGVVDIERIGDEASKIASMAKQLIEEGGAPYGYAEVQHLSNQVRLMLLDALDAFSHMNAENALKVLQSDSTLNREYQSASRSIMTYVMEDMRHFSKVINLLWVFRALERIGKHARNISELVIYTKSGYDVRHTDFGTVEQAVLQVTKNDQASAKLDVQQEIAQQNNERSDEDDKSP